MANSANPEINKKIATSALGTLVIATVFFYLGDRYAETLVTYPGQIFDHLSDAFLSMWQTIKDAPFALDMTSNSLLFGGACFLIIWMIWLRYVAFIGNYRSGEESGSARWGTVKEGKKFKDLQTEDNNLLFTKNFGLALHRPKFDPEYDRNLNVLVVGGSGSGKTFNYVTPNICQLNTSYFVTDPKGTLLGFIGFMRGYTDNRWATFNQIKDAGWHVKKGAKSALIEKWKQFAFYKENEDTGEKELAGRYSKLVGYWNVFNAEDIEGIPPENAPVHLNDRTATIAQNLEESSRCPVIESSGYLGSAAYSPATDRILIAPRETFRSDEAFTRVLLHEMTHSTGHPSALARELDTRFGSPSYAEEELVAELGSLFLSADLGIQSTDLEGEFYENHVSYLQSWMSALENDPSYLFKAASKADHADTFIMERYEEELGKNIEIDAPELEEEVSLAGESHDMASASEHQPESEMPENVLSTVL